MTYRIDPLRPANAELVRVADEEFDSAIGRLSDPEAEGLEQTVHSVRKSGKRIRALLRLARPALGSDYRRTNSSVREASALLSPLRDAHAVLATFDAVVSARGDLLPDGGLDQVRCALAERAGEAADHAATATLLAQSAQLLRKAHRRVDGASLCDSLVAVTDGAARYHGLARSAFRTSLRSPSDEHLHEWRKRVKDGWYHTQLLTLLAPSALRPAEEALHDLADALGDNNDLAVLRQALVDSPDELGGHQAHQAVAVIDEVREELVRRCNPLGARIYAEDEHAYRRRLRGYAKAYRRFGPEEPVGEIAATFGGAGGS